MNERQRAGVFFASFSLYTVTTYAWVMLEFITRGRIHTPVALSAIYLAALTVYVGDKEIRRLSQKYRSRLRHGEYFVYLWGVSFIAVSLFVLLDGRADYHVPADLATNAGVVLLLYFVTDILKGERRRR